MFKMSIKDEMPSTPLPDAFIDDYMPEANPVWSVVYITGFRLCLAGKTAVLSEMAKELRLLESDIVNAWKYWEEKGLAIITDNSPEGFSVELIDVKPLKKIIPPTRQTAAVEVQPVYTPAEIELFQNENEEIRRLFRLVEHKLGKPLKYGEMNLYLSFYDWLKLPLDVISHMLDFCLENGHSSGRYIEKVALDWADCGIRNITEAEAHLHKFDVYRRIMNAFAIHGSRSPKQREIKQMDKWLKEYGFSEEIISEAAERTLINTGQASFAYAEGILKKWLSRGVKTIDDIKMLDEEHESSKASTEKTVKSAEAAPPRLISAPKRRFQNYEGRKWDSDMIEQMKRKERELLLKMDRRDGTE